jgi:hypothetical protein
MALMTGASPTARLLRAVCILGALSAALPAARAQSALTTVPATTPATVAVTGSAASNASKVAPKPDIKPLWIELTPAQQQALAPLASEWNKLDSNHKTKWLAISKKYATMSPDMQQRLHQNMADWAKLTPEQHRIARDSYARAKKLNPEQKTEQWQQYQQLPEEQKQKLAADAAAKKHVANLPNPHNKIKTVEPLKPAKSSPPTPMPAPANPTANRPTTAPADTLPASSAWAQPSPPSTPSTGK